MIKLFPYKSLSVLLVLLFFVACTTSKPPKRDKKRNRGNNTVESTDVDLSYSDDLSKYRPVLEVEGSDVDATLIEKNQAITSTYDISSKMDRVLDTLVTRNNRLATLSGFTILVYSGNSEVEAGRVRNRLYDILPTMESQLQYKLPTYFVKVGQFYQQIEAQPLYEKIKKYYPNATVVPEKFKLEK